MFPRSRRSSLVLASVLFAFSRSQPAVHAQDCELRWEQYQSSPVGSIAFDRARGVTVVVAGNKEERTYEWDGRVWTLRVTQKTNGTLATYTRLAYDALRGECVRLKDTYTWTWDGRRWTVRSQQGPPPRRDYALAYDEARGVTVLFGGTNQAYHDYGDTWEWDGAQWTLRLTEGPEPRSMASLSYDPIRRVSVLFGGYANDGRRRLGDTWEWDGFAWTRRADEGPSPRYGAGMAYDRSHALTVLAGGWDGSACHDLWVWDGLEWRFEGEHDDGPHDSVSLAYDDRRQLIVAAGYDVKEQPATFEWSGRAWRSGTYRTPGPRYSHAAVYDSKRGTIFLFGGWNDYQNPPLCNDSWEWDGVRWRLLATSGPDPRSDHAMAYDSDRDRVVLFGGYRYDDHGDVLLGDTWEWDGQSWSLRALDGPTPRMAHGMAYDPQRKVTVLSGGYCGERDCKDTWEWDGQAWSYRYGEGSPPGEWNPMTYDSSRQRVVTLSYALDGYLGEWDGHAWTTRQTENQYPDFMLNMMTYDSSRDVMLMYDGYTGALYQLINNRWSHYSFDGPTPGDDLYWTQMVFDTQRQVAVIHGGLDFDRGLPTKTWELHVDCRTGSEQLQVKCKPEGSGSYSAIAKLHHALPGRAVTFRFDGRRDLETSRSVSADGMAKARFRDVPAGSHFVEVLRYDLIADATCP